jgi:hypothetical protein
MQGALPELQDSLKRKGTALSSIQAGRLGSACAYRPEGGGGGSSSAEGNRAQCCGPSPAQLAHSLPRQQLNMLLGVSWHLWQHAQGCPALQQFGCSP